MIMKIANDKKTLGKKTNGKLSNVLGWFTTVIMGVAVLFMISTWLIH
jgi:Mn2+/Fe2+ NRAMP family transporter